MKKFLLTFGLMMCGLLSSHADPTSAPPAEQIPMGYDEKGLQSGRPRTILPDVTAERSNSIVSVHVKRYTGYVSTYIVDSNGGHGQHLDGLRHGWTVRRKLCDG